MAGLNRKLVGLWTAVVAIGLNSLMMGCDDESPSQAADMGSDALNDSAGDVANDGTDGCADDCVPPPPTLGEPVFVVPSDGLPEEATPQEANNNLDIVAHDGRFFFAWRTAPTHFASPDTVLNVVSSTDQENWSFEASFSLDTDLREPRFLSIDGHLFLYFAVLGTDSLDFEPQGSRVSEYMGPGNWTEPDEIFEDGFIPWRARVIDGVGYVIGYTGGENIYEFNEENPVYVYFLKTQDGRTFEPVVDGQPIVLTGGSSETDFAFLEDGSLVAVSRNELGDDLGFGSKICRASAEDLGNWECVGDPKKYDSPVVFTWGGQVYLIGRRHLSETGNYDLGYTDRTHQQQIAAYQVDYWTAPKRCALWRVDPESLTVSFVLDLPSRGDTCFPSILWEDEDTAWVYNYTSPLDGRDLDWNRGQLGDTLIYRIRLDFTR